jgi:hypothetical protein
MRASGPLTCAEEEAVPLAEVADGRVDLLAEEASLAIGFHERDQDAPVYLQIAQPCIKAGADTGLVSSWIDEGAAPNLRGRAWQDRFHRPCASTTLAPVR